MMAGSGGVQQTILIRSLSGPFVEKNLTKLKDLVMKNPDTNLMIFGQTNFSDMDRMTGGLTLTKVGLSPETRRMQLFQSRDRR